MEKENRVVSSVRDNDFPAHRVSVNSVGQIEQRVRTLNRSDYSCIPASRPRMDRNRRGQELACRGSERQRSAGYVVTKRRSGEAVGPTDLAFSGLGFVPISMIAHENFIRCAVHKDAMGIGQPRVRTLYIPQRVLVLLERSRIDIDPIDMLGRDEQFVILNIQKNT